MCIHIQGLKELYQVNEHCTSMLSDMFTKYNEFIYNLKGIPTNHIIWRTHM